MAKLKNLLGTVEFQAVVFCVFLFLYIWPLQTTFGEGRPIALYVYFYVVLCLHVCCLLLVSLSVKNLRDKDEGNGPGSDRPW